MKYLLPILLSAGLGIAAVFASDSPADATNRDSLEEVRKAYQQAVETEDEGARELAQLRLEIAETQKRLGEENRIMLAQTLEFQRKDPIASKIHEELLAAEKEVRLLRSRLQARLEAIEEYQDLNAKRMELVAEVQKLRDRERTLAGSFRDGSAEELEN